MRLSRAKYNYSDNHRHKDCSAQNKNAIDGIVIVRRLLVLDLTVDCLLQFVIKRCSTDLRLVVQILDEILDGVRLGTITDGIDEVRIRAILMVLLHYYSIVVFFTF